MWFALSMVSTRCSVGLCFKFCRRNCCRGIVDRRTRISHVGGGNSLLQVPGNQQATYMMIPVVALIEDGDIIVTVEAWSFIRKDINEIPITVIVRAMFASFALRCADSSGFQSIASV